MSDIGSNFEFFNKKIECIVFIKVHICHPILDFSQTINRHSYHTMITNIQTEFELILQVVYPVGIAEAQFCLLPTAL